MYGENFKLFGLWRPLPNAARRLLYASHMRPSLFNRDDFTLRIVVTDPEPGAHDLDPGIDEEAVPTRPFKKPMLGVVPVVPRLARPKPEPLSADDQRRLVQRARAYRKIAWARNLLRKFNFDQSA